MRENRALGEVESAIHQLWSRKIVSWKPPLILLPVTKQIADEPDRDLLELIKTMPSFHATNSGTCVISSIFPT